MVRNYSGNVRGTRFKGDGNCGFCMATDARETGLKTNIHMVTNTTLVALETNNIHNF